MMNFDIKIFGMEELTRKLQLLSPVIRNRIRQAQRVVSAMIVKRAKQLVPVDTGFLKSTIHGQWSPHNPLVRQVVADAPYAIFVEYGRKMYNRADAQPFLRPAMLSVGVRYTQEIEAALAAAIVHVADGGGWLSSGSGGADDRSSSNGGSRSSGSRGGKSASGSGGGGSGGFGSGKGKNVGYVRVKDTPRGLGAAKLIKSGDENSFARNALMGKGRKK